MIILGNANLLSNTTREAIFSCFINSPKRYFYNSHQITSHNILTLFYSFHGMSHTTLNNLLVLGLLAGRHGADDVRVSRVGDAEHGHTEILSTSSSQLNVVAGVVMDACLRQHCIVLDLTFPMGDKIVYQLRCIARKNTPHTPDLLQVVDFTGMMQFANELYQAC